MAGKKKRFRAIANRGCPDCAGSGWQRTKSTSQIGGREMNAVKRCHCVKVIDFGAPKKPKRIFFDGKRAATGE